MTESPAPLDQKQRHNKLLILIAAYKGLLALLFFSVGIGAMRLLHKDIGDVFEELRDSLHFSPESRFVNFLLDKAALVNDPMLRRIGFVAFAYAALSLAEGTGLYLEKAWGELLTLGITASFLPWEVFEIFRHITWVRVALLIVNTLVFLYLIKVIAGRRKPAVKSQTA